MDDLEALSLRMQSLIIFRNLLRDEALKKLLPLLDGGELYPADGVRAYADFVAVLFAETENLTDYVWARIASDENPYILKRAQGKPVSAQLEACLAAELETLQTLSHLDAGRLRARLAYDGPLPEWETQTRDFAADYRALVAQLGTRGYGPFAEHSMFSYEGGVFTGVKHPDPVRLAELYGYEGQRAAVLRNTEALLAGKPAANVLLYGDAGTGKSSTVKAIINDYADRGLRLVELRKEQLREIPDVIARLWQNPLKFILFIDDLSYAGYSEEINALKAILEGTVSARAHNVVIYATSNRRHLVNERFSDRGNDELHANETIQELVSLSDRFGLSVSFMRPSRADYLDIVQALATQHELADTSELELLAERYALERGGRSPRVAKQFVDYLLSME